MPQIVSVTTYPVLSIGLFKHEKQGEQFDTYIPLCYSDASLGVMSIRMRSPGWTGASSRLSGLPCESPLFRISTAGDRQGGFRPPSEGL